jgi:predicted DNA-binding protein (MmcQ/YjbR family)
MSASLERVRVLCLALPETTEQVSWGDVPTFRVRNKIFVLVENTHAALWCKAPTGFQAMLLGSDPSLYFAPPYLGGKGWVGVRLTSSTDWNAVAALAEESYRLIAPKRLAGMLKARLEVSVISR